MIKNRFEEFVVFNGKIPRYRMLYSHREMDDFVVKVRKPQSESSQGESIIFFACNRTTAIIVDAEVVLVFIPKSYAAPQRKDIFPLDFFLALVSFRGYADTTGTKKNHRK